MVDSQRQSTTQGQAITSDPEPQQAALTTESQSQNTPEEQNITSESPATRTDVSVWAIGGTPGVDVGNGESVKVPNTAGRAPTREEIFQALVATGHQERAE